MQGDPAMFMEGHTSQIDLGNGVMAIVGIKKPDDVDAESAPTSEEEMGMDEEEEPGNAESASLDSEEEEKQEFESEELASLVEQFNSEVQATEQGEEGNPAAWVSDEALWEQAKRASQEAFGEIKYPFVVWWYLQH